MNEATTKPRTVHTYSQLLWPDALLNTHYLVRSHGMDGDQSSKVRTRHVPYSTYVCARSFSVSRRPPEYVRTYLPSKIRIIYIRKDVMNLRKGRMYIKYTCTHCKATYVTLKVAGARRAQVDFIPCTTVGS